MKCIFLSSTLEVIKENVIALPNAAIIIDIVYPLTLIKFYPFRQKAFADMVVPYADSIG